MNAKIEGDDDSEWCRSIDLVSYPSVYTAAVTVLLYTAERLNPYALRFTGIYSKILLLVDAHDTQLHSDRRDSAQPTHHSPQSSNVYLFELNMQVMN